MIDLRKDSQLLYISSVDISLNNGPGVNEREFVFALQKAFSERVHFLIPGPQNAISEINSLNFTFSRSHRQFNPVAYFAHLISQFRLANVLLVSGKFDFLVLRLSILPLVEMCITRRYRVPYAIKTLGSLDILWQQGGIKGVLGKALTPFVERLFRDIASRALAIDACTQVLIDYHQHRLPLVPSQIHLIENATDTERFYPVDRMTARSRTGLYAFDPIIGYAGGRPWERGGSQMLEIAGRLLQRYPSLGMVVLGGGSGVKRLKARAQDLGVKDHCIFPGSIPYNRVPDYINAFDVGISFDTEDRLNTYGNSSQKVRQYLSCGKPVVSGPGGNHFLVREGLGSIVEVGDLEQITSAAISWLSLADEQRHVFSQRARSFAIEHLSVRKALDDRIDFWNSRLGILESKR
jgi:glycosyltransferase involved in cell wall biosynthesis